MELDDQSLRHVGDGRTAMWHNLLGGPCGDLPLHTVTLTTVLSWLGGTGRRVLRELPRWRRPRGSCAEVAAVDRSKRTARSKVKRRMP